MRTRTAWIVLALAACHGASGGGHEAGSNTAARRGKAGPAGGDRACSGSAAGDATPAPAPPPPVVGNFKPTAQHPHLFWTPERLAKARQWVKDTSYVPKNDKDEVLANAFYYVVTKSPDAGKLALEFIHKVMSEKLIEHDDQTRWNGELFILVYDWCFDLIPQADRATILAYANTWFDHWNHEAWGGPGHEEGNYFWGYLRNGLEWALASSTENPKAQDFLDDALVTRWDHLFLPFAQTVQKGGLPSEGTQYGRYQEAYPLLPFLTLASGGRNIFDETDWYRGATYYNIYNTPPSGTTRGDQTGPEMFPDNDDQFWLNGRSAAYVAYGDFMTAMSMAFPDKLVGQHARRWLDTYRPDRSIEIQAADPGGTEADLTKLPFDYFAPGAGFFWMHSKWAPDATTVLAQFGFANSIGGHQHLDAGTFQIWRKGRWLSRETVEYLDDLVGYDGVITPGRQSIAHNALVYGGHGTCNAYQNGMPKVTRLESRKDYSYIATDLTDVYRAPTGYPDRDDNPYSGKLVRELVFLRDLETTVILDRMETSDDSLTRKDWTGKQLKAEDVPKTFLLHFEQTAKVKLESPSSVLGVNGDQALHVVTLVPKAPTYRIVDERPKPTDRVGQFRLEIETKGSAQGYFINVLQARDATAPDLTATIAEDDRSFTVTLVHPNGHKATINFAKGMASTGGTITTDGCANHELADYVQQISVTDSGPIWGP